MASAQKAGATLVVIDPRATKLARLADIHLAVKPGTDVAIALALHRHLFENGHADQAFLAAHALAVARVIGIAFGQGAANGTDKVLEAAHRIAGKAEASIRDIA